MTGPLITVAPLPILVNRHFVHIPNIERLCLNFIHIFIRILKSFTIRKCLSILQIFGFLTLERNAQMPSIHHKCPDISPLQHMVQYKFMSSFKLILIVVSCKFICCPILRWLTTRCRGCHNAFTKKMYQLQQSILYVMAHNCICLFN